MPNSPEDLLSLPYEGVRTRPHMPPEKRAAQFLPFSPLAGFGDILAEDARETQPRPEPDEDAVELLNRRLRELAAAAPAHPAVTVTWFQPDGRKEGGAVQRVSGSLRRVDPAARQLIMRSGETIPFDLLLAVVPLEEPGEAGSKKPR